MKIYNHIVGNIADPKWSVLCDEVDVDYIDLGDGTHKSVCTFCKAGEVVEAHTYGEYTPNGDATTEADGTKTAKCDKCDATDTVADEGSKLVEDIAQGNFFNNIVDKIMSFFESIINFFKNLFN